MTAGFREVDPPTDDSNGLDRISQYQLYQRGIDTRSGNLIVSDSTHPRVLLGNQQAQGVDFYGMKVSKPGYDVNKATDSQLLFNSDQNILKVVATGTASITVPGTMVADQVASTTVTHGLGYKPAFMCYITGGTAYGTSPDQNLMMPFSSRYVVAGTFRGFFYTDAYVTDTTIVFRHTNNTTVTDGTGGSVELKYYLLQETAN